MRKYDPVAKKVDVNLQDQKCLKTNELENIW